MDAGEGACAHADALFQGLGAKIGTPGPDSDDGVHGVGAGIHAHFLEAHKGQGTQVGGLHLVDFQGLDAGVVDLLCCVGHVDAQDFAGVDQALGVFLQPEDSRTGIAAVVSTDAFKSGVAVVQCVAHD